VAITEKQHCTLSPTGERREHMSKEDALKTLILLSSLESWTMSVKVGIPEPYRQHLTEVSELLTKIVLGHGEEK